MANAEMTEGWVPAEHYEEAMARSKKLKEDMHWRRPDRRKNGLRSRRTGPWTTWTKRNTCNELN